MADELVDDGDLFAPDLAPVTGRQINPADVGNASGRNDQHKCLEEPVHPPIISDLISERGRPHKRRKPP